MNEKKNIIKQVNICELNRLEPGLEQIQIKISKSSPNINLNNINIK